MTNWYKNWFDSEYYHILYNKRDHTFSSTSLRNRIGVYNEEKFKRNKKSG